MTRKNPLPELTIKAQKAMRKAVRNAIKERIRLGISLSILQNGKLVRIPAKKIDLKSLGA